MAQELYEDALPKIMETKGDKEKEHLVMTTAAKFSLKSDFYQDIILAGPFLINTCKAWDNLLSRLVYVLKHLEFLPQLKAIHTFEAILNAQECLLITIMN